MYLALLFPEDSFLRDEDGPIESAGALALFAASIVFFLAYLRSRKAAPEEYGRVKRGIVLLLALAFLFDAGEELSWAQRIIGFEAPAQLREVNRQDEFNLHNAADVEGLLTIPNLFKVFSLVFVILVPVAYALSRRARRPLRKFLPILPLWLAALFLLNQLAGELAEAQYESPGTELWETSVAVLFVVVAYAVYVDAGVHRSRDEVTPRSGASG